MFPLGTKGNNVPGSEGMVFERMGGGGKHISWNKAGLSCEVLWNRLHGIANSRGNPTSLTHTHKCVILKKNQFGFDIFTSKWISKK